AFWFFLITGSFLAIWILTRDRDIVPASALALMGISATTALGAVLIDSGKNAAAQSQLDSALARRTTLAKAIADLESQINPTVAPASSPATDVVEGWKRELQKNKEDLNALDQTLTALKDKLLPSESKGFLKDILSDADGIALHRFQIFIWTLVLGV